MIDIKQALKFGLTQLSSIDSSHIDTEVLLAHLLQVKRSYLFAYPEKELTNAQWQSYQLMIQQRSKGIPIAYLLQEKEFWSLPFFVNQHTLIPRPETELLVDLTLNLLKDRVNANILDLGTGSGVIALSIGYEKPGWNIAACDKNLQTLEVAQVNAKRLQVSNVSFYQSNWFTELPIQSFDAILSNPPYISTSDPHLAQGDVRFEPIEALASGKEGLEDLIQIITQGIEYLNPQGFLLVEHGHLQNLAVQSIFSQAGYKKVQSFKDIQGHYRVSGGWV